MPVEIEKKYRLTQRQRQQILSRLPAIGANREAEDFEENTLYTGETIDVEQCVLRLRRVGGKGTLTYKERSRVHTDIKHQEEDETSVGDPEAMASILDALGFTPILIYEKRRETWKLGETEIVIDELPFGLFMEIEGDEHAIREVEGELAIKGLKSELSSYPRLTLTHGTRVDGVIEARFPTQK
ncbi:MAG TPA: class IV adenylate cyclase [Pyrinomonadaceae bacterium]|nr:class IV adenylate cyclase [Pyrinomonadaceae bacterium]